MDQLVIDNIIQMVKNSIEDIVKQEGEIRSMHTYGHSVFIKFDSGKIYQQPLMSEFNDLPLLDEIGFN